MDAGHSLMLSIFMIIVIITCSSLITYSYSTISVNGKNEDDVQAKNFLEIAMIVGWVSTVIFILAIGALFMMEKRASGKTIEIVGNIVFALLAIVFVTLGILSLIAAVHMSSGSNAKNNETQFTMCLVIAGFAILGVVFVIIYYIYKYIHKRHVKKQVEKRKADYMLWYMREQELEREHSF